MKKLTKILVTGALCLYLSSFNFIAYGDEPSMSDTHWEQVLTKGKTICSSGSPYAFYVNRVNSGKLLIYFQPGGALLEGSGPAGLNMFDPTVALRDDKTTHTGTFWDHDDPAKLKGIFDLEDKRNPFLEHNMVFIPYCTADVHLGDRVNEGIRHNGYNNVTSVLSWVFENFKSPESIFVAGSSAGSIAAPYYATVLAEHYPKAKMAVLSDSLGGVHTKTKTMQNWGMTDVLLRTAGYEEEKEESLGFDTIFLKSAKRFPSTPFALFNTYNDRIQKSVLSDSGVDASLADLISSNNKKLREAVDNIFTYTVDKDYHVVLLKDHFYKENVDGLYFYNWVSQLANGVKISHID